ncbi:MAG TPA: hypothetical protein VGN36_07980 [Sphingorhabdus sp.]|jgi:hypothetical protein|nr:hypothetical protein [Sphingorhabdus sp.]
MDDILKRLSDAPVPARLARLDDAVLAGLAERQSEARATSRMLSAAAVVALGVGYAGGSLMPSPTSAAEHRLVISETALAPSTLLDFL